MFDSDRAISLESRVVKEYLFDLKENFVGVTLNKVGGLDELYAPNFAGVAHYVTVDARIVNDYESTRLIGFRTTKKCKDDKLIKSIQPIYYSKNEEVCKTILQPVSNIMMNEPQEYGHNCYEALPYTTLMNNIIRDSQSQSAKSENEPSVAVGESFTFTSFLLIWIICAGLVIILVMKVHH